MKKLILILFLITIHYSFYAQSSEKISSEMRNEVDKIKKENQKEEKTVRDPYYKIKIIKYGTNLIEYDRIYENYYHFNQTYILKDDIINYLHDKGQSAK